MLTEVCFLELRDFPLGNIAFFATLEIPFIPQPSSGPASLGMSNHESLVAVSGDLSKRSLYRDGFNPVQKTAAGGPQSDVFEQDEKIDLFADVFVFNLLGSHPMFLS
jgi:hypothetical protein